MNNETKDRQDKILSILYSHFKKAYDDGDIQVARLVSTIVKEIRDLDGI